MTDVYAQNSYNISRWDKNRIIIFGLWVLLLVVTLLSLVTGAASLNPLDIVSDLLAVSDTSLSLRDKIIFYDIRLPRTLMGLLIGASLAVSGVIMQGIFRNPLADPGTVGVGTGAGLGAVIFIVLGQTVLAPVTYFLGIYHVPLAAFTGGLLTTWILYRVATRQGQTSVMTLLLAGIALGAISGALMGILIYMADDRQLRDLTFWGLGSLAGSTHVKLMSIAPFMLLLFLGCFRVLKGLNMISLGEAAAYHMGTDVQKLKNQAILLVALSTGASVAATGGIGFIGIVVPHLLRLWIGPDHHRLVPASALLGGSLLLGADMVARQIVAPAELPIGIVTALIGGPFFLWILLKNRVQFGGERG